MPIPSFDKSESHSHSQLSLFPDACLVSRNSNCRIFRIKAFDKGNLIPKTENPIVGNEEIWERRSARSGAPRATNQALLQARPAREGTLRGENIIIKVQSAEALLSLGL